jgi:hypothetical protein
LQQPRVVVNVCHPESYAAEAKLIINISPKTNVNTVPLTSKFVMLAVVSVELAIVEVVKVVVAVNTFSPVNV